MGPDANLDLVGDYTRSRSRPPPFQPLPEYPDPTEPERGRLRTRAHQPFGRNNWIETRLAKVDPSSIHQSIKSFGTNYNYYLAEAGYGTEQLLKAARLEGLTTAPPLTNGAGFNLSNQRDATRLCNQLVELRPLQVTILLLPPDSSPEGEAFAAARGALAIATQMYRLQLFVTIITTTEFWRKAKDLNQKLFRNVRFPFRRLRVCRRRRRGPQTGVHSGHQCQVERRLVYRLRRKAFSCAREIH